MFDKLLSALGKEVSEVIGFEAQPEAFDSIKIWAVRWKELWLEIMPL